MKELQNEETKTQAESKNWAAKVWKNCKMKKQRPKRKTQKLGCQSVKELQNEETKTEVGNTKIGLPKCERTANEEAKTQVENTKRENQVVLQEMVIKGERTE